MTTKRDPRVDPRPGDVVRPTKRPGSVVRNVTRRTARKVWYNLESDTTTGWGCWIGVWREMNADAEIVKVAE